MTHERTLAVRCLVCGRFVQWADRGPDMYLLALHTTNPVPTDGRIATLTKDPKHEALCLGSETLGVTAVLDLSESRSQSST